MTTRIRYIIGYPNLKRACREWRAANRAAERGVERFGFVPAHAALLFNLDYREYQVEIFEEVA